jgi:proteic killer suppression protein
MQFEFADDRLERLYYEPSFTAGLARPLVRAFRKVVWQIDAAPDEREFYARPALRFEKLKRSDHERSLRINDQFRLVIELTGEAPNKIVRILGIEDYH